MSPACTGTTFLVDDVTAAPARGKGLAAQRALESFVGARDRPLEACEPSEGRLIPCGFNGFVAAAHYAYSLHAPLAFAPDHVWLAIAQGLAVHLRLNPEHWRAHLVGHEGRHLLEVRHDGLTRHAPAEEWAKVWDGFIAQLEDQSPEMVGLLTPRFSTTGLEERLAFAVTAMDVFEPYFDYRVDTVCGIPAMTLEGTRGDWLAVRARAEHLRTFGLEWWLEALLPVLDQFVATAEGDGDRAWWQGFYKDLDSCPGPFITGHIRALFPYVWLREQKLVRRVERQALSAADPAGSLLTSDALPGGVSRVPFTWRSPRADLRMEVVAGFMGVREGPDGSTLRPQVGWAVRTL